MDNTSSKVSIQPLLRMKNLLEKSLVKLEEKKLDELGEMGAVQAFEVSYELAWHTCQKVLKHQGEIVRFARDTFRLSAELGLIKDLETWFKFMEERNETSHTYDFNVLEEIFAILPRFIKEFDVLIKNLQKLK